MVILTPFRRMTDPIQVPVSPTPQKTAVDASYFNLEGIESFWIVNPNVFWVRLKGSGVNRTDGSDMSGSYVEVVGDIGAGTGWLFPPGFSGVFTSQKPRFLSTVAVTYQGLQAGTGWIELAWGQGL